MNVKQIVGMFLMIAGAAFALSACADDNDAPTTDVLHVVADDTPQPFANPEQAQLAKAVAASENTETPADDVMRQTECLPSGISKTHFSEQGRDATVTFTRANYFVALANVEAHDNAGAVYNGEVEIVLPEQSRVFNITKNSAFFLLRDNGQFAFMADLAKNALNQRYIVCAAQIPSAFWRPKDIPSAPRPRITPPR